MRRHLHGPAIVLIAAAIVAGTGPARSATINWTGGTSFWDLVANWSSTPLLPGAADDVVINVAGVQTITHRSGTDTVSSLSITGDDLLAITGGSPRWAPPSAASPASASAPAR